MKNNLETSFVQQNATLLDVSENFDTFVDCNLGSELNELGQNSNEQAGYGQSRP